MKKRKCKEHKRKRKIKQKGIAVARFSGTRYSYLSYSAFRQNALLLVWLKSRQPGLKISLSPPPPLYSPLSPNCSIAAVALPPSTTPPPPEAAFDHTAAARRLRPHRRRPRPPPRPHSRRPRPSSTSLSPPSSSPLPTSTSPPLPEPEPALAADRKAPPLLSPTLLSLSSRAISYICWYCVDVHMNPRCSYEP